MSAMDLKLKIRLLDLPETQALARQLREENDRLRAENEQLTRALEDAARARAVPAGFASSVPPALGGCTCYGQAPTVPVFRSANTHLGDCPARDSGVPVGVFSAPAAAEPQGGARG